MKRITEYFLLLEDYKNEDFETLSKMSVSVAIIHTFDDDGKKIKTEYLNDGEIDYVTIYKYNSQDQVVESLDIRPTGDIERVGVSYYNKKGLLSESLNFNGNKELLIFKFTYQYDDENNLISESYFDGSGFQNIKHYTIPEPDSNQRIQIERDKNNEFTCKTVEFTDRKGRIIRSMEYDSSDALTADFKSYYDDHGNLIKEILKRINHPDEESVVTHWYEYTYDKNNNWIRCIHHYQSDKEIYDPPSLTLRRVEEW